MVDVFENSRDGSGGEWGHWHELDEVLHDRINSMEDDLGNFDYGGYEKTFLNEKAATSSSIFKNRDQMTSFLSCMRHVYFKKSVLFCVDLEMYERNTNLVSEIGMSIYDPRLQGPGSVPHIKNIHIVIEDCLDQRNGRYVVDNKDHFLGGDSMLLSWSDARKVIRRVFLKYFDEIPRVYSSSLKKTYLVGHGVSNDIKLLVRFDLIPPSVTFDFIDTQAIWAYSRGLRGSGLSRVLKKMNIPHAYLHNAGNDAYYTLVLCLHLFNPTTRVLMELDRYEPLVIPPKKNSSKKALTYEFGALTPHDTDSALSILFPQIRL